MDLHVSYAGFWKRFLAHLLDQFILSFVRLIILFPFGIFIFISYFGNNDCGNNGRYTNVVFHNSDEFSIALFSVFFFAIIIAAAICIIVDWLYFALMESSKKQATLGKMIVGIKVTDLTGNKISFGRATCRYFAKILSSLILGFGYIIAAFTEKKQALHDILAGCVVVNTISSITPDINN